MSIDNNLKILNDLIVLHLNIINDYQRLLTQPKMEENENLLNLKDDHVNYVNDFNVLVQKYGGSIRLDPKDYKASLKNALGKANSKQTLNIVEEKEVVIKDFYMKILNDNTKLSEDVRLLLNRHYKHMATHLEFFNNEKVPVSG